MQKQRAAIDYLRMVVDRTGLKPTSIARSIEVHPSTINRPLSDKPGKHAVSEETLFLVRNLAQIPFTAEVIEAYGFGQQETNMAAQPPLILPESPLPLAHNRGDNPLPDNNFRRAPEVNPDDRSWINRERLPLWGTAMAGEDGAFEMNTGEALAFIARPPLVESPKAYCIRVEGDSMEDHLSHGDLLFVDPSKKPLVGRFAVIEMRPTAEGEPRRAFVKRVVALSTEYVRVQQYNPPRQWDIPRREVENLHLVLKNNEMFA